MLNLGFISQALQNLLSYFFSELRRQTQSLWFKKTLYIFVLIKCIYWIRFFELFFGSHSIVQSQDFSIGFFKNGAFLLLQSHSLLLNALSIGLVIFICGFNLIFNKFYFIPEFILWFLVLNIHNAIYATNTGGDYLLNQFLFFNCFLISTSAKTIKPWQEVKTLLHNIGVLAIMIQVCLAYLISAIAKLYDLDWQQGEAIGMVAQIKHFSLFYFPPYNPQMHWWYALVNYTVLAYQCVFAIMAWLPWFKKPFLLAGVAMHLYIGLVMGLPLFSLVMIIGYIFFWPVKKTMS